MSTKRYKQEPCNLYREAGNHVDLLRRASTRSVGWTLASPPSDRWKQPVLPNSYEVNPRGTGRVLLS